MTATVLHGDCLEVMAGIPDGSVDMICCDLPYGTTRNKWDSVIPLDALWEQYKRLIKPNGAIVLTAAQPFTSALVMSNAGWFKYDWIWKKHRGRGHLNAKKQPLRDKEDVLVFCAGQATYNPQMTTGAAYRDKSGTRATECYDAFNRVGEDNAGVRYPRQVLEFAGVPERAALHPTQKPVALIEYLIRTYTNEGETVLDNCAGSGTTGVACINTGRKFIGIERDPEYFRIASDRIAAAQDGLGQPAPKAIRVAKPKKKPANTDYPTLFDLMMCERA